MSGVDATLTLPDIERHVVASHGRARALTPAEEDVLQEWADEVREYVVDRWPVDTGTSADMWEVETGVSPGSYGITISNDMDYVEWVHYAGTPAGTALWEILVREAWSLVRPQLVAELTAAVDATEAELRRRRAVKSRDVLDVYRRPLRDRPSAA